MRMFLVLAMTTTACQSPPLPADVSSIGEVEIMIGAHTRKVPFHDVECGNERYELRDTQRSVLQIFMKPGSEAAATSGPKVGAVAYLNDVAFDGEHYQTIMLTGLAVEGGSEDFRCRLEQTEGQFEVTCNNVAVRPWLTVGDAPKGAFRAKFHCIK